MASWVLASPPLLSIARSRIRLDFLNWSPRAWSLSKNAFSVSLSLPDKSPAMKAIESYPYPSTTPDTSIFEELSDEYVGMEGRATSITPKIVGATLLEEDIAVAAKYPCFTLFRLVQQGKFSHAERVRSELAEMGVPIRPDRVYSRAASAILRRPQTPVEGRESQFANWLALIPDADASHRRRSFKSLHHHLAQYDFTNPDKLRLVMIFGVILASKGYSQRVCDFVISSVFYFAEPPAALAFLEEFERAARKYAEARVGPASRRKFRAQLKEWYSLAARTHISAGRLDAAMQVLNTARSREIAITAFTYSFLLKKLGGLQDERRWKYVVKLWQMQDPKVVPPTFPSTSLASSSVDGLSRSASLATQLRHFKSSLTSSSLPSTSDLAQFIHSYQSWTGRTRALCMLRERAQAKSVGSLACWLMGEMLYYEQRHEPKLLIVRFAASFHIVGVPRAEVLRIEAEMKEEMGRIEFLLTRSYPATLKIRPSPHHCAAVWRALISLCKDQREIRVLYDQLLDQSRTALLHDGSSSASPHPPERPVEHYFNAFLSAFSNPEDAVGVLADMKELGISPGVYTYTLVVGILARAGLFEEATKLLDFLEASPSAGYSTPPSGSNSHYMAPPTPNLTTYTNVLRAFVDARHLDDALAIEERMMLKIGYVHGTNRQTDLALKMLRRLEDLQRTGQSLNGTPLL
ncbi:hypothetical protein JAAARDRAFT_78347 [Jaapia argillacea MUCL 33604]|uniref:Pentacotripeptide-repeat region of PRORP domain-containing protein n=1 Tax=Jaapia argillacea MUCL 33604 TaxID=933084 RepID=A0A067PXY3_9AGAM|nr:hypothetical protein JAAARDRAFT_78347 [Jaapia argillacea MUCL 33604]